jgi:hypothetical protein
MLIHAGMAATFCALLFYVIQTMPERRDTEDCITQLDRLLATEDFKSIEPRISLILTSDDDSDAAALDAAVFCANHLIHSMTMVQLHNLIWHNYRKSPAVIAIYKACVTQATLEAMRANMTKGPCADHLIGDLQQTLAVELAEMKKQLDWWKKWEAHPLWGAISARRSYHQFMDKRK